MTETASAYPYINLLGSIRVLSHDGKDYSASFTHTLRNIFAYIIINEAKDGTGVTSRKLDETFWNSDDPAVTANKRNVTMSRLRSVLRKTEVAELYYKNGVWYIRLSDGVSCDFTEILPLMQKILSGKKDPAPCDISRIISLGSRGMLLSDIEEEWCDNFKSWYLMIVSESVRHIYETNTILHDYNTLVRVSDMMLSNDPLDETAVKMKCRAIWKMGKAGHAKACFDNFRNLYHKIMGEFPDMDFDEIVSM